MATITALVTGLSLFSFLTSHTPSTFSFYALLLAPLLEELCFRGLPLTIRNPRFRYFADFFATVLFSILHPNQLTALFAALCFLYLRDKYGMRGNILAHYFYNWIMFFVFFT